MSWQIMCTRCCENPGPHADCCPRDTRGVCDRRRCRCHERHWAPPIVCDGRMGLISAALSKARCAGPQCRHRGYTPSGPQPGTWGGGGGHGLIMGKGVQSGLRRCQWGLPVGTHWWGLSEGSCLHCPSTDGGEWHFCQVPHNSCLCPPAPAPAMFHVGSFTRPEIGRALTPTSDVGRVTQGPGVVSGCACVGHKG